MKVTDAMVDRAAIALWDAGAEARIEHYPYPFERLVKVTKDDLRRYARAALEAALDEPPKPYTAWGEFKKRLDLMLDEEVTGQNMLSLETQAKLANVLEESIDLLEHERPWFTRERRKDALRSTDAV